MPEVTAESFAQLKARAQESGFDGGDAQAECLRSLFRREIFNVAQGEDGAEAGRKALDGLAKDVGELGLVVLLLGIGAPLGEVTRDGAFFGLDVLVHGDGFAGLALAETHEALVDRDADEPGRELGVSLELVQLLVSLEECVLRDVFGVFTVLGNVLCYAEDLALVLPDELLKCSRVPVFRALLRALRRGGSLPFAGDWMAGMSKRCENATTEMLQREKVAANQCLLQCKCAGGESKDVRRVEMVMASGVND